MSDPFDSKQAWSDYWRGQTGGCLPESASSPLNAAFRDEWLRTASGFSPGAQVLDLATGDGVVLRWLSEVRADLGLIGVDLAEPLPPPPPGCVTRGGVAMETLPFEAQSFDAVVSQFGFEYGELDRCAAEAARVLRRGATLTLVTHHADGPIVAHNRQRAAELGWALADARLIDCARAADQLLNRREVDQAPGVAIARFGKGSAGWQLAEAIARVVRGAGNPVDAQGRGMLDKLERMARGEIERIKALERASAAASDAGRLDAALVENGLALVETHPVIHAADGLTVATYRSYIRA